MKILCFSVTPTNSALDVFGINNKFNGGGWIDSLIRFMPIEENNSELWVCSLMWGIRKTIRMDNPNVSNIHFICFPSPSPYYDSIDSKSKLEFKRVIEIIDPDVVHIFGTETINTKVFQEIAGNDRTLISITGLVSICEKHFWGNIKNEMRWMTTIRDLLRGSAFKDYRKIKKAATIEIATIKNCRHVTGRTDWDKACITLLNPNTRYYFCNENLRDSFYCNMWSIETCEHHSIFASSSASPLKGAHQIIEALPIVKKFFPDVKLYLTGNDPRISNNLVNKLKRTGYQKYLCKLLNKYDVNKNVIFTGALNEQQMSEQYTKSNVYVLTSNIENSSNSLCEAMLLGVPTVASDVGGTSSLLENGKDGFLYPFDEPYMMAYRIIQLFSDEKLANMFSQNARARALKRHDRKINGEMMFNIYQQVFNNNHK